MKSRGVSQALNSCLDMDNTKISLIDGSTVPQSSAHLPPADTKRWSARRKAAVVTAVRSGTVSLEEACRRYHLSEEEFCAWEREIGITQSPVYGSPDCKYTVMFLSSNKRSSATEQPEKLRDRNRAAVICPEFWEDVMRLLLIGQNLETTASVRLMLIKEKFICDTTEFDDGSSPASLTIMT